MGYLYKPFIKKDQNQYLMKHISTLLLLIFLPLFLMAQTATINLSSEKQLIKGFGGMNHPEWAGDLSASERETAFSNGKNQLGLSILRIFISDNRNDWSRAVATAKAAQAKGLLILASPWNPPIAMTEIFTKSGDADAKRLKYSSYADYAQHLIDFITYMKSQGVNIYAISVQNEPDWGSEWTWWTATEMYNFVKNNAGTIKAAHPDVKIMASESFGYGKGMTDPILNDPTALANMDILGVHTYGVTYPSAYPLLKTKPGKEFWMTEVYHPNSDSASANRWPEALEVGLHIHRCLVDAEMQAYIWWYIKRNYGPIYVNGTISKRGDCMAQFSKFVRPGYLRVDVPQNPTTDVYVSAYKKGSNVTIVAINKGTTPKTITLSIPGATALSWEQYVTSETQDVEKGSDIYSSTSFQVTLAPKSMATYVSVSKPVLKLATPENESFDLPLTTKEYKFIYSTPVSCSLAEASLIGPKDTIKLGLLQTGYSDTLTFSVPADSNLIAGNYKLTVSGIVSETNENADANTVIKFTLGESSAEPFETLLMPEAAWLAQQATVGEGIPLGWKRTQGSNNQDVDGDGAANTGASRMKYFPAGGDFRAGFYFSAREFDICRITYGEYPNNRIHLKPGKYRMSFYSAYWSGTPGFTFLVKNLQAATIYTSPTLTSALNLGGNTIVVNGSELHELTFTITTEADYIMEWNTSSGWDGVAFGGIKLTTEPSLASTYKTKLADAIAAANTLYASTDTILYDGSIRTALASTVLSYQNFTSTSPSAYNTATSNIEAAATALSNHKKVVDGYLTVLSSAKAKKQLYSGQSIYTNLAAYSKLVLAISTNEGVVYDNETAVKNASTNLTNAVTALDNTIASFSILRYRITKGIALARGLKTRVPEADLADALAAVVDDDQVATALNAKLKEYVETNLRTDAIVFKKDTTNTTLSSLVDSLDLTNFIKNPNFYTMATTNAFTSGTFPGWSSNNFNSLVDASMQPLATENNPIVDSWVCTLGAQIDYFEQTVTNVPAGIYNLGLKVRLAPGSPTTAQLLDNMYLYVKKGAVTYKTALPMVSNRALPANPNAWIRNLKFGSGDSFTIGVRINPIDGFSPTVFFGDPVLFMVGENKDVTALSPTISQESIKEVQYFTLMGARIQHPVKGLNVVKTIFENGSVKIQKIQF